MKQCKGCNKNLQLSSFAKHGQTKDGLFGICKRCQQNRRCGPLDKFCSACENIKPKNSFHETKMGRLSRYCNDCAPGAKESVMNNRKNYDKDYYRENYSDVREKQVWSRLQQRYGISRDQYEEMLDDQGGVCAVCGASSDDGARLNVDHNHKTGRVRGLLCKPCNFHIGILEKRFWVGQALEYLEATDPDWIRTI